MHYVVMLHPKASIRRPPMKAFDTTAVNKADQFPEWHRKFADSIGIGALLKHALNMRSLDTLKKWGEKLMRQHRPADPLTLPEFLQPQPSTPRTVSAARPPRTEVATQPSMQTGIVTTVNNAPPASDESVKRLIYSHCDTKISDAEGKFCWNQTARFGGHQYGREHQALF